MRYVRIHRTGSLVDITGSIRRIKYGKYYVTLTADDGTKTVIPREVITRIKVQKDSQP